MRKYTICLLLFILTSFSGFAQSGGKGVFRFINLPNSSKIAALGSAFPMSEDAEISESFQNPSLISNSNAGKLDLNYSKYISDINFGAVQYGFKLKNSSVISVGLLFVDYGKFEETDAAGNSTGSNFTAGDYLINIGYAKNWQQKIYYGANLKLIYGAYDIYKSAALASDIAITYKDTLASFSTGIAFRNIGYQLKSFGQIRENLPFQIDFSMAQRLKYAPFRYHVTFSNIQNFDLTYQDPNDPNAELDLVTGKPLNNKATFISKFSRHLILGAEILLSPSFNLLAGYNFQKSKELNITGTGGRAGLSFGFSLHLKNLTIGYANASLNAAGSNNYFSLMLQPSIFNHKKPK
jgi:hypothetical protein